MKKIWLLAIPVVLILSLVGVRFYGQSTLPQTEGELSLDGLQSPVEVIRDEYGIPHIYAQNEKDAFIALGYVMGGDRLFQMDLMRRVAAGRLSEIIGPDLLFADKLMRTLRIRATAEKFLTKNEDNLDPKLKELARAFYKGLNTYKNNETLPIEFALLGYEPEDFDFFDGLSIAGYMALTFAEGLVGDMLFTRLLNKMPADQVAELRISTTKDLVKKISQTQTYNSLPSEIVAPSDESFELVTRGLREIQNSVGLFPGSNSWVLSGDRSKSGHPILANDPHISYSQPAVLYEAYIHTPTLEIYGHFLPLMPFPILGHNKEKGWAITMSEVDDLDLYAEKINPENPNQVMFKNKWVDMEVVQETIKVKGQDPQNITVRVTPHGPLIDDTKYGKEGQNISMRWLYHEPDNDIVSSFYGFLRAKNLEDYKKALTHTAAPGLNISWVDADGNIAWWMLGKIPVRPAGMRSDIVNEGWSGKNEYKGFLPTSMNPHMVNPEDGVIVSANYQPIEAKYSDIPGYWQPSDRYERIDQLLRSKQEWSIEELKKVQTDSNFLWAPKLISRFNEIITRKPELVSDRQKKLLDQLVKWDGESDKASQEAALFYTWIFNIGKEALEDELGEKDFKAFYRIASYWHFFKSFAFTETSPWWDNTNTKDVVEDQTTILLSSLKNSISSLDERFGGSEDKWRWGQLHSLILQHPIGKKKPFDKVFNLGPIEAGAGSFQVNNMAEKKGNGEFNPTVGPATRRLIDMKNPTMSWGIIPSGNSGNLFSPHYGDQMQMYVDGKYRPQIMIKEKLKGPKLKLVPVSS